MLNTECTVEWQALEIYCKENVKASRPHLYVCFKSPADRNDFYQLLLQQKGTVMFRTTAVLLSSKYRLKYFTIAKARGSARVQSSISS